MCAVFPPYVELMFLETSALTGENVEEGFLKCARTILNKIDSGTLLIYLLKRCVKSWAYADVCMFLPMISVPECMKPCGSALSLVYVSAPSDIFPHVLF